MWHAAGYVTAGLSLLDRFPARANTMFDRIAGDRSLWQPTIDALLDVDATPPPQNISGCKSGYSCAQNIASLLSWQIMTNNSAAHGGGLARYAAFASWYVDYLVSRVDTATGLWCEQHQQQKHGTINCIGGSFHVDFVLQYLALHPALVGGALARAARFPMPGAQLNTSLGLQRRDGGWTDSGMAYLNVDGIYQATRPSLQIGRARWNDVRAACDALLSKVVPALNNGTRLLDTGGLSSKTHNLPALVAAVAECQKHFGAEMVLTTRPWKMCLDDVPYI